ncbi:hypothetical protein BJV82DRAFT_674226 [Fennellomyces sp. T-0311]|nr:hypothetical protein BJV82DRAFT_674226 [Fennellomyces sp. T-0311]
MSANEYCMAVNVIYFVKKHTKALKEATGHTLRSLVAEVCGIGKSTAQKALAMYKANEILEDSSAIERPKLELKSDYVANVHEIVLGYYKRGNNSTFESITAGLYKKHSHWIAP